MVFFSELKFLNFLFHCISFYFMTFVQVYEDDAHHNQKEKAVLPGLW